MAKTKIPTAINGLVQQWDETGLLALGVGVPKRLCLDSGASLGVYDQTTNTSAGNVANQAVGTVKIPSGTADGGTITITNTLITAASFIFLQVAGTSNKKLLLDTVVPGAGSATFKVRTVDAAATTADCDCWYQVWN